MIGHMSPNAMLLPPLPPLPSRSSVSLLASAPGEVPTHEEVIYSEEVILETEQCHMNAIQYGGAKSFGFLQAFTAALKEHGDNHRAVRETVHEKFRQPSGGKIVDGVASGCGVGRGWQTNMGQQRQRRRRRRQRRRRRRRRRRRWRRLLLLLLTSSFSSATSYKTK